jgi:hypothetical protein
MTRALSASFQASGVLLCLFLLFFAAGTTREGAALRRWDEAGTAMNPSDDRPWARTGLVEGLVLVATLIWVPIGLSGAPRRSTSRAAVAQALLFRASAACLLIAATLSGMRSASQPVARTYRWMLAAEVVIAPLGFWWGAHLWAEAGSGTKPKKSRYDELAV